MANICLCVFWESFLFPAALLRIMKRNGREAGPAAQRRKGTSLINNPISDFMQDPLGQFGGLRNLKNLVTKMFGQGSADHNTKLCRWESTTVSGRMSSTLG